MSIPAPVPGRRARRQLFVTLIAIALAACAIRTAVAAPPSVEGRWSAASPGQVYNSSARTAIHMALLRGDDNWQSDPAKYHSYLLTWESRNEFCNVEPFFHGSLFGWRPGSNLTGDQSFMNSGFTLQPLSDSLLSPPYSEVGGHDLFCAGQSLTADGRLALVGGAGAENSGSLNTSFFDPHRTGNRWITGPPLAYPRW